MAFNITSVTQSASLSTWAPPSPTPSVGMATANNLGYGLGRLFRGALDQLKASLQSTPDLTEQRAFKIYRQGLREAVHHLNPALDRLRKNPQDAGAFRKVQE